MAKTFHLESILYNIKNNKHISLDPDERHGIDRLGYSTSRRGHNQIVKVIMKAQVLEAS